MAARFSSRNGPTRRSRPASRHILTYPQYWTWRLSGALASEISFLGCHSHMWNPLAGRFSSLAVSRGWAQKFPPFAPAGALIGERDGLGVHNGVHDSNAAFYYYRSLGFSHFTLISSGTWVIIFNPDCPLDRLDPARDMLANVTVDGEPVATIRFMGGREYDVISGQARQEVSAETLRRVIARGQMALPSFAAGGPFPAHAGRLVGPAPESAAERAAIATLYVAMMTAQSLDLVSSTGDIILDGGLALNGALCATLAALRPGHRSIATPTPKAPRWAQRRSPSAPLAVCRCFRATSTRSSRGRCPTSPAITHSGASAFSPVVGGRSRS